MDKSSKNPPKLKTHVALAPGFELIIDSDQGLGSGIADSGSFILHCRRWNFELTISPAVAPYYEKDGVL
ncbi:MAG: hypothetical protein ABFD97_18275 [Syntrophobacter sp.]